MKPVKCLALLGFVAATIAGALVATQSNVASSVEATTVAEEPTGPLHLETSKVKSFSDFHFETMEGPSGDTITTYYFAAGSGAKANIPEVRFITDGTNTSSSPKVFAAVDTTEVHFWYKLVNASEVSIGDPDKPYTIQILDSDGGYNAVNWDPINDGKWHVTKFTTDTKHDKFCGFVLKAGDMDGSLVVADIRTYKTAVTDLETVFPESFNMNFTDSFIDNGFFDITLTEKIFTTKAYINDHYNEFLDVDGNVIPLRQGIVINGKTLGEWIDYVPEIISYPRNDGVTCFPVNANSQFNPIAVEVGDTALLFKFSLEEIPLDSVVVTFKAGLFYGYYNNTTFTLDKDITYYANVTTSNAPTRIVFSKTPNWIGTYQGIREVADWGEHTASQGGKYHRWLVITNIARDTTNITQGCPVDNYRYMYDNVLMNGKPITYYNAWARGNSKDFTNLADPSTQNPDYEVGHPTGSANTQYDLAIRIEVITDQANYFLCFNVPNQLLEDLNMVGNPTFTLRDGSAWLSIVDAQSKVVRYDAAEAVDAKIEAIGTVSLDSETAINEARAAYDALSADGKSRVTKLSVLEAAEARLAELKTAKAAAEAVDAKIEAIGTVSLSSEDAISEARAAYEALNEEAKGFVTKLNVLQTAEARLAELKTAKANAAEVDALFDAIPDLTLKNYQEKEHLVTEARAAYEALSEEAKGFVEKISLLVAAEARLVDIKAGVAVDAKIDAIGEEITFESENAINEARAAYNALSEEQTRFVTKLGVLEAAEARLAELKTAKAAAEAVDAKIEAIGTVSLSSEDAISEARAAYEALNEEAKGFVTKLNVLQTAEARLAELKTAKANAAEVDALISQIGQVETANQATLSKIQAAENAYANLTAEEKALVSNYTVLEAARSVFDNKLAADKQAAHDRVEDFMNTINLNKYSKDNQDRIGTLATQAESAINAAQANDGLNGIVDQLIEDINAIPQNKAPAKKGCGGSIAATSVVLSTLALAGLGLVISRKRKED